MAPAPAPAARAPRPRRPPPPSTASSAAPAAKGKVVIGTFDFNESKILANLYSLALIKAGYTTEVKTVGAREITEPALEKGSSDGGVDVVPEYLATVHRVPEQQEERQECRRRRLG